MNRCGLSEVGCKEPKVDSRKSLKWALRRANYPDSGKSLVSKFEWESNDESHLGMDPVFNPWAVPYSSYRGSSPPIAARHLQLQHPTSETLFSGFGNHLVRRLR